MDQQRGPAGDPLTDGHDLSKVPEVAPVAGEVFGDYVRRAIVDDDEFRSRVSQARSYGVDIFLGRVLRPPFFTPTVVEKHYRAFSQLRAVSSAAGIRRVLDHLWIGQSLENPPLDLRMALVPSVARNPLSDLRSFGKDEERVDTEEPVRVEQCRIDAACGAAKRRDFLMARICGALRAGVWQASGYQPGDLSRTMVPVVASWWSDSHMECDWRAGELRPIQTASPGHPTFLGLVLSVAEKAAPLQNSSPIPSESERYSSCVTFMHMKAVESPGVIPAQYTRARLMPLLEPIYGRKVPEGVYRQMRYDAFKDFPVWQKRKSE